jgi:hypothetical protein
MNFNAQELVSIKQATSGMFKGGARKQIAQSLQKLAAYLDHIESSQPQDHRQELIKLLNSFTEMRQEALRRGAKGYSDPNWASAAACESWLQELLTGDERGVQEVERLILALIERG